jgi:hypothetical protein
MYVLSLDELNRGSGAQWRGQPSAWTLARRCIARVLRSEGCHPLDDISEPDSISADAQALADAERELYKRVGQHGTPVANV